MDDTVARSSVPLNNTTSQSNRSDYSGISVLISILLCIIFVVFTKFLISDLQQAFVGEKPSMQSTYNKEMQRAEHNVNGQIFYDNKTANDYFDKFMLLPYESKSMLVSTSINVPLFIIGVFLILSRDKFKKSMRLAVNAYFASVIINMLTLITELSLLLYKVNQKITVYGVSILLITVFIVSIIYLEEKHKTQKA